MSFEIVNIDLSENICFKFLHPETAEDHTFPFQFFQIFRHFAENNGKLPLYFAQANFSFLYISKQY